jgi:hypothetical protein
MKFYIKGVLVYLLCMFVSNFVGLYFFSAGVSAKNSSFHVSLVFNSLVVLICFLNLKREKRYIYFIILLLLLVIIDLIYILMH